MGCHDGGGAAAAPVGGRGEMCIRDSTSAALVQRIPWNRREHIHGFSLTRESVRVAMEALAPMSMEERRI